MTTMQAVRRRDRWADWAVVILVGLALLLGLLLRESVLSRAAAFTATSADVRVHYPATWVREIGSDPLLRARDARGGAFDTTLELRNRPLAVEADPVIVLDALALERAGQVTAYQTLRTDQVGIDGETWTRRTFTYVHVDPNPYVDRLPVVVRGIDLALRDGERTVVVTFLANVDDFEADYRYFRAFFESLRLGSG